MPSRITYCPLIIPISKVYDYCNPAVVVGTVESGSMRSGQSLYLMPEKVALTADDVWTDEMNLRSIGPGDNIHIKLDDILTSKPGRILCDSPNSVSTGRVFIAEVEILHTPSLFCAGYVGFLHLLYAVEAIQVTNIICMVDTKTGERSKERKRFVRKGDVALMKIDCENVICVEPFKKMELLGKFTIEVESVVSDKPVATGKVLKVLE